MIDLNLRADPAGDGIDHINTHSKSKTQLGQFLSLSHELGEAIHHPILGAFRTVENLWCYLNTGGNRDSLRSFEPHIARNLTRLSPKYRCDRFKELITDVTLLKLEMNTHFEQLMVDNELPFDHYFLNSKDRVPIRPGNAAIYISILNDVQKILRGERSHEFVRYSEMNFKMLDK